MYLKIEKMYLYLVTKYLLQHFSRHNFVASAVQRLPNVAQQIFITAKLAYILQVGGLFLR